MASEILTALPPTGAEPDPTTACAHCGLPVGSSPLGNDPWFCCTGCEVVYSALHSSGMADTYYTLQQSSAAKVAARSNALDPALIAELDAPAFLEKYTHAVPGGRQVTLFLDGVHCAACVWLVERMPYLLEGAVESRLNLARARLDLTYNPAVLKLSDVARWLVQFGYVARPASWDSQAERTAAERKLLIKMGICWALAGNAMLLAFLFYSGMSMENAPVLSQAARWISLGLAMASMAVGGAIFVQRAWASIRHAWRQKSIRLLHLDTPIAIGLVGGYAHSAWNTIAGTGEVWFDSLMVLTAALLTARFLQLRARRAAGDASDRLLALVPSAIRRLTADGQTETVTAGDLTPGDLVEVLPGEVIPVDGVVAEGVSQLSNAVLTGESRPESTGPGMAVSAAATNLTSRLVIRVKAAGDHTRVGKLLTWVRERADKRPEHVHLVDYLAGYFVTGVLVASVLTFVAWLGMGTDVALHHVVALLVIACPCALGMATPLSYAIAVGLAARRGIFIKREDALEVVPRADVLVLDKTGTLTQGKLDVANFTGREEALRLAAALERGDVHPLARAFALRFDVPNTPHAEDIEALAGFGRQGWVEQQFVMAGKPDWVATHAKGWNSKWELWCAHEAAQGRTPVLVAVQGQIEAALSFGDTLRPDARDFIAQMHAQGRTVFMLSGDHPEAVKQVGRELGLEPHFLKGGYSPEQKQAFISDLAQTHTVIMVGDGVNDAAALQAAHVGVAVEGGTTASLVAADIFLTQPGLSPIAHMLEGAARTRTRVRIALTLSLLYNAGGALAAAFGLVTPFVAAVAMPLSSLAVVALALTQRSFRVPT